MRQNANKLAFETEFEKCWRAFQNSTPKTYAKVSFRTARMVHGPEFPNKAFETLSSLREWYKAILFSWLHDVFRPGDFLKGKLPSQENELALCQIQLAARSAGVRRIHRRIFRDRDRVPRELPITNCCELSNWCDFMFELLDDDDEHVDNEREVLTFRYDKGVDYRLEQRRKETRGKHDDWVADVTHSWMKSLLKGKPHKVGLDDDWIFTIWSGLADEQQSIREITVSLFVDVAQQSKVPDAEILHDMISSTWSMMRRLGSVCYPEPKVTTFRETRKHLDAVKLWCHKRQRAEQDRERNHHGSSSSERRLQATKGKVRQTVKARIYDAFLAHNSVDKPSVQRIARVLRRRGLIVWFDKEQIPPGRWFQDIIQEAIPRCKAAVIFIGPSGLGRWQILELRALITRCVEDDVPVIPVLLPGAKGISKSLPFLKELHRVRFKKTIEEIDVVDELEWGITGKRHEP